MKSTFPFLNASEKEHVASAVEFLININSPVLTHQSTLLNFIASDDADQATTMLDSYTKAITGRDSKVAREAVLVALSHGDIPGLYMLRAILKKKSDADFDRVIHVFNQRAKLWRANGDTEDDTPCTFYPLHEEFRPDMWLTLREHYPEKRCLDLLFTENTEHAPDTIRMLDKLAYKLEDFKAPKKPKAWGPLHDRLQREVDRIATPDRSLNQRDDVLHLDKREITTGESKFVIRVPKTHYDLVSLGHDLNFCIGNGYYSDSVASGLCSIIALFEDGKPRYAVQFNRYDIMQAYGFSNRSKPPKEALVEIEKLVTAQPVMPDDFLSIEDSGWVKGYKYDGEFLYLLLRDRIYAYADVPRHVYEELLASDRKGTYVNQSIKQYACKKWA